MSKTTVRKKRKRGLSATKRNLFIDIAIGLGFLVVYNQDITGDTLHEWLAMALFVGLFTHLVLHWKWVINITKRFFSPKLPMKTRINYLVNGAVAGAFVLIGFSGLMISEEIMPIIGLGNGGDRWEDIHELVSDFSLLAVAAHVLLHWKWILMNTKKYLWSSVTKLLPLSSRS